MLTVDLDRADLIPALSRRCTSSNALVNSSGARMPGSAAVACRPAWSASIAFLASCALTPYAWNTV